MTLKGRVTGKIRNKTSSVGEDKHTRQMSEDCTDNPHHTNFKKTFVDPALMGNTYCTYVIIETREEAPERKHVTT